MKISFEKFLNSIAEFNKRKQYRLNVFRCIEYSCHPSRIRKEQMKAKFLKFRDELDKLISSNPRFKSDVVLYGEITPSPINFIISDTIHREFGDPICSDIFSEIFSFDSVFDDYYSTTVRVLSPRILEMILLHQLDVNGKYDVVITETLSDDSPADNRDHVLVFNLYGKK